MNMRRIMIGQIADNDDTKAFPSAHVYLYPKMVTLVNFTFGQVAEAARRTKRTVLRTCDPPPFQVLPIQRAGAAL